jgi:hypothetical protein
MTALKGKEEPMKKFDVLEYDMVRERADKIHPNRMPCSLQMIVAHFLQPFLKIAFQSKAYAIVSTDPHICCCGDE